MARNPSLGDAIALLRGDRVMYMRQVDVGLARRVGAIAYLLTALAAVATLPVVPPTALIGTAAGWAVAAAMVGGALAAAWWSWHTKQILLGAVYAVDLGLLVGLGALGWLAGDGDLYSALPVLVLVVVAAVFPARSVALAIAVAALAQMPALLAIGADAPSAFELLLHVFTWTCLCSVTLVWTAGVRAQRRALRHHARIDPLTGLGNRRAFEETARAEVARSLRAGQTLSLLVGDLDDFKAVNDRYGHLAGDACLCAVADVVRDLTRQPDSCFRWGGDEFAILLPDADESHARAVAARLSNAVAALCHMPDGRPLSLAFGVAERGDEVEAGPLLARADADLLAVKLP
jgi:diguanylate cyclase (GGDEF)-like protein